MGMSTYVQGVRDLDGRFAEMVRVKKACETATRKHSYTLEDCNANTYHNK